MINLGQEQIQAPEILFSSQMVKKSGPDLSELIYKSYYTLDSEIK